MSRRLPSLSLAAVAALLLAGAPGRGAAADATPRPVCDDPIAKLYDKVSPAVVFISAMSVNPYDIDQRMTRVIGSGVIIDKSGLVLTNSHVVYARRVITVTLDDGTSLPAQLVGADPIFDVALVRIPTPTRGELPVARLGESGRLVVGDDVFAIGNPFGLEQTFTRGIVSAVNRLLPGIPFSLTEPMIQTDAPINPGSSGGPLIDRCGNVVGITTAILPEARDIGFAVPVDLIKEVVPPLIRDGRLIRPWLGVQGQLVAPSMKNLIRVPWVDGFLVEVVEPGSPAEQAGLRGGSLDFTIGSQPVLIGGDIITEIDGAALSAPDAVEKALNALKVGALTRLKVFRDGETRDVSVTLTERPLLPGDIPDARSASPAPSVWSGGARGPFGGVRRRI